MYPFERLEAWAAAHQQAVRLYRVTGTWRDVDLSRQVRRCATSIAANIAEGAGSDTQARFARDVGVLDADAFAEHHAATESIGRRLTGFIRRVRANARQP